MYMLFSNRKKRILNQKLNFNIYENMINSKGKDQCMFSGIYIVNKDLIILKYYLKPILQ